MFGKRLEFEKKTSLLIHSFARQSDILQSLFHDVVKLIIQYSPGKDGSLRVTNCDVKTLRSNIQYEFDSVEICAGSRLTVQGWEPYKQKGGRLILNVFNTTRIHNGAHIDVSGRGYTGGKSLCCGDSYNTPHGQPIKAVKSESGAGGGGMAAGGASYGSTGANGTLLKRLPDADANQVRMWDDSDDDNTANKPVIDDSRMEVGYAGMEYGNGRLDELHLGSGGGSSFWCGAGKGGGALMLFTGSLENQGYILSEGQNASASGSGGGSGGSILIDIVNAQISMFGKISAEGGSGYALRTHVRSRGGSGGCGRICLSFSHATEGYFEPVSLSGIAPPFFTTFTHRTDGNKYRM